MKLPYPLNPDDWQIAYTRDDAYVDSGRYGRLSSLAIMIGVAIISTYILITAAPMFDFNVLRPFQQLGIVFVIIVLVFFLLLLIQSGALRFASSFLTDFYHPPESVDPTKIINYRLYGRFKVPPPLNMFVRFQYILVKEGGIIKSDEWPAWSTRNLGGPTQLIIFDGCALYLERGNRFSRIVGPGEKIPFLEWHETIKYIVDLRPKVKVGDFNAWTKDGININLKVQIQCRIGDPQNHDPNSKLVYPYDPVAVKKAIERHAMRWQDRTDGEPIEFTWIDAAWGQVTGILPSYISSRMLDDLFLAGRNSGQILSPDAMQEIFAKINNATRSFGVYVTDLQVLELKFPPEVEEAQSDQWRAEKQSIATIIEGETKAFSIRTREKARADAQYGIILAIAEGLEKNRNGQFNEPVLLSLSGVLDESLREPLTRAYLAKETLDTLEQLQKMLDHPAWPWEQNNAS